LRGTGLGGLRGMPRVRKLTEGVSLIRPFLSIPRTDLRRYLQHVGQEYRTDSSNADTERTRNRIRLELLPQLEKEYNPEVAGALVRLGQLAGESQQLIEELAADLATRAVIERGATSVVLRVDVLQASPAIVVREALIRIWRDQSWSRDAMGFDEWESLRSILDGPNEASLVRDFPGNISARRSREHLLLTRRV
jgi:tRNA(Ile)-lysidine synthase